VNTKVSQFSLKHRPILFQEMRGQDNTIKELKERARLDKWPTAMLFLGATGVGKTTAGMITAAAIQCQNVKDGEPCGVCATCKDIFEDKFSLGCTHLLDGSTSSKDDVIDTIKDTIHSFPLYGKKHVFIIEEVDQLSSQAKNAFHKLLEKPSPFVHFILLSMTEENGNKVPESIATRCQPYYLKKLTETDVAYILRDVLKKEGVWESLPVEFKKQGIFLIANNAKGSARRALQYLERVLVGSFFTVKEIEEIFHFTSEENSLSLLSSLLEEDVSFFSKLEPLKQQDKLIDWVHFIYYCLNSFLKERLLKESPERPASVILSRYPLAKVKEIIKIMNNIYFLLRTQNYITNNQIEYAFIEYFWTLKEKENIPNPDTPIIRKRA
jgi:DNA polymerase-3 subunit gamma/tau